MTVHLRLDQACIVHDCKRPARHHGLCTPCWMGLSARERLLVEWEAQTTEPIDALQVLWCLPAYEGPRWAA